MKTIISVDPSITANSKSGYHCVAAAVDVDDDTDLFKPGELAKRIRNVWVWKPDPPIKPKDDPTGLKRMCSISDWIAHIICRTEGILRRELLVQGEEYPKPSIYFLNENPPKYIRKPHKPSDIIMLSLAIGAINMVARHCLGLFSIIEIDTDKTTSTKVERELVVGKLIDIDELCKKYSILQSSLPDVIDAIYRAMYWQNLRRMKMYCLFQ